MAVQQPPEGIPFGPPGLYELYPALRRATQQLRRRAHYADNRTNRRHNARCLSVIEQHAAQSRQPGERMYAQLILSDLYFNGDQDTWGAAGISCATPESVKLYIALLLGVVEHAASDAVVRDNVGFIAPIVVGNLAPKVSMFSVLRCLKEEHFDTADKLARIYDGAKALVGREPIFAAVRIVALLGRAYVLYHGSDRPGARKVWTKALRKATLVPELAALREHVDSAAAGTGAGAHAAPPWATQLMEALLGAEYRLADTKVTDYSQQSEAFAMHERTAEQEELYQAHERKIAVLRGVKLVGRNRTVTSHKGETEDSNDRIVVNAQATREQLDQMKTQLKTQFPELDFQINEHRSCVGCGQAVMKELFCKCSKCGARLYFCSTTCQKESWKRVKKSCPRHEPPNQS